MIEIYIEKIKDLLEPKKANLEVHEEKSKRVYVADLTEHYITTEKEVYNIMN